MKRYILTLSLLMINLCGKKTFAQFYNSFTSPFYIEQLSSAIETKDGFVFGFTESNPDNSFHKNILLIKTNSRGNILWSKRYDAGTNTSINLSEMIGTFNDEILISGEIGGDNVADGKRCILKINKTGDVIFAKKYVLGSPFSFSGKTLVQLADSSFAFTNITEEYRPTLMHINLNGDVLTAITIKNRVVETIQSVTARGNTVDLVVGNSNVANIDLTTGSINWQRQYNTSNQFTSLLSSRCQNGDRVYVAGRTSGGTLDGTSRIFRTKANGKLLWAKNLNAHFDTTGNQTSIFDLVSQISIHEDMSGNIVAIVMSEGTTGLMVVLDASGEYLYHRVLTTFWNFIAETSNGYYLHTSTPLSGFPPHNALLSYRALSNRSTCESTIYVNVTNGTDSATLLDPLTFGTTPVNPKEIPVSVQEASIKPSLYCRQKFPIVALSSPLSNSTYLSPAKIKLIANASDPDGTITKVEFYKGTHLLHTETATPYGFKWRNVPVGNYTLTAKAYDNYGLSTTSAPVHISVVPNKPPTVSIIKPKNNQPFSTPAYIHFEANAQDQDGRITRVEFYNGSTLLRTEYKAPYTYVWKNVPVGTYIITAVATDNWGAYTTSDPVTVRVIPGNTTIVGNRPSSANDKIETDEAVGLKLNPNPARSILNVDVEGLQRNKLVNLSILSSSGALMRTMQVNNLSKVIQVNVSSLGRGVYTLRLQSGDKVLYRQFVKL